MDKRFKIKIPDFDVNKEQRIREVNALLKDDFERGGLLNQCIVFTYNNETVTATELANILTKVYKKEYDRSTVSRALHRLTKMDILFLRNSGYLMTSEYSELNETERFMLAKFRQFLSKIPIAFKNSYTNVNYFAIANGFGLEFIEHSCKILKFDCEDIKNNGN